MLIDFAPVREGSLKLLDFARRFSFHELRLALNAYYDATLDLLADVQPTGRELIDLNLDELELIGDFLAEAGGDTADLQLRLADLFGGARHLGAERPEFSIQRRRRPLQGSDPVLRGIPLGGQRA
ncbi:MAG: hypothetical protein ACK4P1_06550, partial [Aggregatilineales bacterium]